MHHLPIARRDLIAGAAALALVRPARAAPRTADMIAYFYPRSASLGCSLGERCCSLGLATLPLAFPAPAGRQGCAWLGG